MKKAMWLFPVVLAVGTATFWKRKRRSLSSMDYLGV